MKSTEQKIFNSIIFDLSEQSPSIRKEDHAYFIEVPILLAYNIESKKELKDHVNRYLDFKFKDTAYYIHSRNKDFITVRYCLENTIENREENVVAVNFTAKKYDSSFLESDSIELLDFEAFTEELQHDLTIINEKHFSKEEEKEYGKLLQFPSIKRG